LANDFVRVRLVRIAAADLNVFEFDWDLTWAAFFMNASGKIYGRFGGRDSSSADSRNTLEGLHYAMKSALDRHRQDPKAQPEGPKKAPLFIEKTSFGKSVNGCIHCHQAKELMRLEAIAAKTWSRDDIYTYPLPENVGITLDKKQGDLVQAVRPKS